MKSMIRRICRTFGIEIHRARPTPPTRNTTWGEKSVSASKSNTGDGSTDRKPGQMVGADATDLVTQDGPAMCAPKTYIPNHPTYDPVIVKNFPGTLTTVNRPTERTDSSRTNPLFEKILFEKTLALAGPDPADYDFLAPQQEEMFQQVLEDPDYLNFRQKMDELESFISGLNETYPGEYHHGGISQEDGHFLYWIVRLLNPKSIVQTGVSNGVSCAHITLALKHNDAGGKLYAIDYPYIYDPQEPEFHQKQVYGVLIPNGKTSGWLVPDGLKDHFQCWQGDAKKLLPEVLAEVAKPGQLDMFYHDSDHSYDHMNFEFHEALPYVRAHGIILSDDIAWSTVTWDFAADAGCYAFNHRGSQGIVFL